MPCDLVDLWLQATDDLGGGDVALTSSGLRLIWMRPQLSVVLVPSTPMKDETLSTAGSSQDDVDELLLTLRPCWRS